MSRVMERDPYEMVNFAKQIDEYENNMKNVCNALIENIDTAKPFMRDAKSEEAFQKILDFAEELKKSLPEALEAKEKLVKSADPLFKYLES